MLNSTLNSRMFLIYSNRKLQSEREREREREREKKEIPKKSATSRERRSRRMGLR